MTRHRLQYWLPTGLETTVSTDFELLVYAVHSRLPSRRFHHRSEPRSPHRYSSGDLRCLSHFVRHGAGPRRFVGRAARRSASVHSPIRQSRTLGSIGRVRGSQPISVHRAADITDTQIRPVPVHKPLYRLCVRPVTIREGLSDRLLSTCWVTSLGSNGRITPAASAVTAGVEAVLSG